MTFPATSATLARTDAGNTFTGSQTLSGGTITASSPIINAAQTWNASGATFTALALNVTDTASAASSLLMDLQVGAASQFSVGKDGVVTVAGTGAYALSADVLLRRDAANILALRNGVNAQAFNIYNTFTDASNYERGVMRWVSNNLEIGTQAAGTGTARDVIFNPAGRVLMPAGSVSAVASLKFAFEGFSTTGFATNGSNFAFWLAGALELNLSSNLFRVRSASQFSFSSSTANTAAADTGLRRSAAAVVAVTNGTTGGGSLEMQEVTAPAAPATNNVRIYAEDNGSGKTRLMALFATGAAQQIAIEP
jgi:hypothetical protein